MAFMPDKLKPGTSTHEYPKLWLVQSLVMS